jgi:hypothetical protein
VMKLKNAVTPFGIYLRQTTNNYQTVFNQSKNNFMKKELKKAIVNFILDNDNDFQLTNNTTNKFRLYIYDNEGEYLIGGEDVKDFIYKAIDLITGK